MRAPPTNVIFPIEVEIVVYVCVRACVCACVCAAGREECPALPLLRRSISTIWYVNIGSPFELLSESTFAVTMRDISNRILRVHATYSRTETHFPCYAGCFFHQTSEHTASTKKHADRKPTHFLLNSTHLRTASMRHVDHLCSPMSSTSQRDPDRIHPVQRLARATIAQAPPPTVTQGHALQLLCHKREGERGGAAKTNTQNAQKEEHKRLRRASKDGRVKPARYNREKCLHLGDTERKREGGGGQ